MLLMILANGLPELKQAQTMGVMGKSVIKGFAGRFFDAGRRIKIRLTNLQMDDAATLTFKFLSPFQYIHDNKGGHFAGAT